MSKDESGSRKGRWERSHSKRLFSLELRKGRLWPKMRGKRGGAVGGVRGDLLMSISGYHLGPRTL